MPDAAFDSGDSGEMNSSIDMTILASARRIPLAAPLIGITGAKPRFP